MTLRIALDHNFPVPIVSALGDAIVEAALVPVGRIDRRLTTLDDDQLIRALWLRDFHVFVTCDHHMLDQPRVLAVVLQTKMTVIAAMGQGDDRVAASGLVLAHLPHIARQFRKDVAQVWRLNVGRKPAEEPWVVLEKLAKRESTSAKALYTKHSLSRAELTRDPLDDIGE